MDRFGIALLVNAIADLDPTVTGAFFSVLFVIAP